MEGAAKKSRVGGIVAGLFLALLVVFGAGAGFEQIQRRRDQEQLPEVGWMRSIGERSLNVFCSGEGSPAVILESDALKPGYSWLFVQRQIAQVTRTCWYDRPGYGWSIPGAAPHTSTDSARDLQALLRAEKVEPPYVMVGDGFGTLNLRVYNGLFPNDVAGMVFVDAVVPEEERMGVAGRIPFRLGYPSDPLLIAFKRIGLMRLVAHRNRRHLPAKGLTAREQAILSGLERLPSLEAAFLAEEGFSTSLEEVRASPDLGGRPLVVMSSGGDQEPSKLMSLSTHARQVAVRESGGDILYEAPEAIVAGIRDLVAELRRR